MAETLEQATSCTFIDLSSNFHTDQFAKDVLTGLTAQKKHLPVKYLYDHIGSSLFEKITQDEHYYLTRAEEAILNQFSPQIVQTLTENTALVELGCGSAMKTRKIIEALLAKNGSSLFVPIDISGDFLIENAKKLYADYPNLNILGIVADYHIGLEELVKQVRQPKLVLWLGSDIAHIDYIQTAELLRNNIIPLLNQGDKLLLGIDLKKSAHALHMAYGCVKQTCRIHQIFTRNLLHRINRELVGNFKVKSFQRHCFYCEEKGCVVIYLECMETQTVTIKKLGLKLNFVLGDRIQIHNTYKYNNQDIQRLAVASGLQLEQQWFDPKKLFSVNLFVKKGVHA